MSRALQEQTVADSCIRHEGKPGKVLRYGSTGNGSTNQLGAETMFAGSRRGLKLLARALSSGAPAIADVATVQNRHLLPPTCRRSLGPDPKRARSGPGARLVAPNPMVPDLPLLTKDIATSTSNPLGSAPGGPAGLPRPRILLQALGEALSRCQPRSIHRVIVGVAPPPLEPGTPSGTGGTNRDLVAVPQDAPAFKAAILRIVSAWRRW